MLTIVIPTLNEEKFIGGLLSSIKSQNFRDYEIILADAGSTDKTIEIAKSFGCRIVKGGLPAKGRNEGAKAARGNLLLFLDADTELQKEFLKKAFHEFYDRKLDIASCRLLPLESVRGSRESLIKVSFELADYLMVAFEKLAPFGVGSMILVKPELHKKAGGFDENVRFGEDTIYIRKAAKLGKFGVLKSVKIHWSIRRFEKENWLKPIFLYILGWFLIGIDTKALDIFKKGFFEYKFGHYQDKEGKKFELPGIKTLKKILEDKFLI